MLLRRAAVFRHQLLQEPARVTSASPQSFVALSAALTAAGAAECRYWWNLPGWHLQASCYLRAYLPCEPQSLQGVQVQPCNREMHHCGQQVSASRNVDTAVCVYLVTAVCMYAYDFVCFVCRLISGVKALTLRPSNAPCEHTRTAACYRAVLELYHRVCKLSSSAIT